MNTLKRTLNSALGLFPLTAQGGITLVVAAGALNIFAYGALDLVVFALTICALSIFIFCLFNTVIVGVYLQRRIRKLMESGSFQNQNIKVEAGYPNESGLSLPAPSFLPLTRLSWQITYPDSIDTRIDTIDGNSMRESIVSHKRCLSNRIDRQFSVSDVLGFCRFSWKQEQHISLQALPQTHSIKQLPVLRSLTAEDGIPGPTGDPEGDRMEIRPYAPGDSVKNIMWKVFARSRQLNVRLPENSVFHSNRTVAYLLSSKQDEAAAAVARIALESGALGEDWEFGADGTTSSCTDLADSLKAVANSRALEKPFSYGLDQFLERSASKGGVRCVVFGSAESAPWLEPLKQTISRFPGQFSLILAADGIEEPQHMSLWHKLAFRAEQNKTNVKPGGSSPNRIKSLLTDIGLLVESMLIVDRTTGLSFDRHLRKV